MTQPFSDSSGKGHVLNNSGATITGSQYVFNNASAYFNGSSYVTVPNNSDFNLGSIDFTIDFWVNFSSTVGSIDLISKYHGSNSALQDWTISVSGGNLNFVYHDGTSVQAFSSAFSPSTGTWYHIAVVRDDTNLRLFVNGLMIGTHNIGSSTIRHTAVDMLLGVRSGLSNYLNGYLDEVRIYRKVAVWNENFIPPNAAQHGLEIEDVLLLHLSESTLIDSSRSTHSITNNNVTVSSAQSKFGGSSAYFNGTSSYLSIADSDDWDFSSGDFTIDCWIYPTAAESFNTSIIGYVSGTGDTWPDLGWTLHLRTTSGIVRFQASNNGSAGVTLLDSVGILNAWHHVAVVRASGTTYLFIDGILKDSTATSWLCKDGGWSLKLGIGYDPNNYYTGYLDEVRVTKGVARWTQNFIPEIEAYPGFLTPNVVRDETKLLCHFDGLNGSTNFYDYGKSKHTITRNGSNMDIRTDQSKFGGSSAYFNGTDDYLSIADSDDWNFGSGDFTIDCWLRISSIDSFTRACIFTQYVNASNYFEFYYYADYGLILYATSGGIAAFNVQGTTASFSLNTWYHVAAVRSGSTFRLFVNGIDVTSSGGTDSDPSPNISAPVHVGLSQGTVYFHGHIDELRVTKGQALFEGNFTPANTYHPLAADQDNVLLLHMEQDDPNNNAYTEDDSVSKRDVFFNSSAQISSTQKKFGDTSLYLNGSGDCLSFVDSTDFDLGLSDEPFTIECWFNTTLNSVWSVLNRGGNNNNDWSMTDGHQYLLHYQNTAGYFSFYYNNNGSSVQVQAPTVTVTDGNWHHVAVIFDGTTTWVAVDGTLGAGITTGSYYKPSASDTTRIGVYQISAGGGDYVGYFDEFRISKGIARWTSNFAVPTGPYPNLM